MEQSLYEEKEGFGSRLLFIPFLIISSGMIRPIELTDGSRGEYFIYATCWIIFGLRWLAGPDRNIFAPLGRFWIVIIGLLIFKGIQSLTTSEQVAFYPAVRSIYYFFYTLAGVYIFRTVEIRTDKLIKICYSVALVMSVLVLASAVTKVRMFAAVFGGFADLSVSRSADWVSGNVRFVPFYFNFIAFLSFLCLTDASEEKGERIISHHTFWFAVCSICILLSFSRSIIAVWAAIALAIIAAKALSGRIWLRIIIPAAILIALAWVIPSPIQVFAARLHTRFTNVIHEGDTWRMLELNQAIQNLSSTGHWLTGFPLGARYTEVMGTLSQGGYAKNADYDMHNEHMWDITYFGLFGFTLLWLAFGTDLIRLLRRPPKPGSGAAGLSHALVAFLGLVIISGLFSSTIFKGFNGLWTGAAIGLASRVRGERQRRDGAWLSAPRFHENHQDLHSGADAEGDPGASQLA